jgi:hypothetical protein
MHFHIVNMYKDKELKMRNSCVKGREVKCFNAIAGGEGPRLYVL